jgi:hypothetical protein
MTMITSKVGKMALGIALLGACVSLPFAARSRGTFMSPTSNTPPAQNAASFQLRTPAGKILIAEDDLVSYDWSKHTFTLGKGVRERLSGALRGQLIHGSPFVVVANGVECYRGVFTTSVSSVSQTGVVVDLDPVEASSGDRLEMALGYPTPGHFKGKDPRGDERIRAALTALGKLR